MGLQKKKLHALLPIIMIMMVGIGIGATVLFVSLPPHRVQTSDVFQDDVYVDDSDAGGTVSVSSVLTDARGEVIRRTNPNPSLWDYSIVDPDTNEEVANYGIELVFDCWGKNIDWTTFVISGTMTWTKFTGVKDIQGTTLSVTKDELLDTKSLANPPVAGVNAEGHETVGGFISFAEVNVIDLMPTQLVGYDTSQEGSPSTVFFNQQTSFDHPIVFEFDCAFALSVSDDWNNPYDSSYNLHVVLTLLWSGSEFGVEWGTGTTDTGSTSTDTAPTTSTSPVTTLTTQTYSSAESMTLTNTGTSDALAAAFTGAYGSMILVIGVVLVLIPVMVYWWLRKK